MTKALHPLHSIALNVPSSSPSCYFQTPLARPLFKCIKFIYPPNSNRFQVRSSSVIEVKCSTHTWGHILLPTFFPVELVLFKSHWKTDGPWKSRSGHPSKAIGTKRKPSSYHQTTSHEVKSSTLSTAHLHLQNRHGLFPESQD